MTDIEITTLVTAIVGAGTGIGALALSIVNTCMQLSKNRVKLRIVPMIALKGDGEGIWATSGFPFPDTMNAIKQKQHRLCVEVTNLSSFAVTIQKVGFGKFKLVEDGINIPFPIVMKNKNRWPLKLESRESDLLMLKTGSDLPIDDLDKNCAFVATECGHIAYGTSCVFNAYVEELKKEKIVKDHKRK